MSALYFTTKQSRVFPSICSVTAGISVPLNNIKYKYWKWICMNYESTNTRTSTQPFNSDASGRSSYNGFIEDKGYFFINNSLQQSIWLSSVQLSLQSATLTAANFLSPCGMQLQTKAISSCSVPTWVQIKAWLFTLLNQVRILTNVQVDSNQVQLFLQVFMEK